jgi:hypothetical protein
MSVVVVSTQVIVNWKFVWTTQRDTALLTRDIYECLNTTSSDHHVRYLRLTLHYSDTTIEPMHKFMRETTHISEIKILHGNISNDDVVTFMYYIEGDHSACESCLNRQPNLIDYDITPVDDESFYVYMRAQTLEREQRLIEAFTRRSLVVIPPIEYRDDGSVHYTLIGSSEDLRAAVDAVPSDIQVTIEQVGDYDQT